MYEQILDPVADSLGLSAIFAALPLLTLFILLGVLKVKAWIAALVSLYFFSASVVCCDQG